jgi:hypothetical protein
MGSMQMKTRSQEILIYQYKECVHITQGVCIAENGWRMKTQRRFSEQYPQAELRNDNACERKQNVKQICNKNRLLPANYNLYNLKNPTSCFFLRTCERGNNYTAFTLM